MEPILYTLLAISLLVAAKMARECYLLYVEQQQLTDKMKNQLKNRKN